VGSWGRTAEREKKRIGEGGEGREIERESAYVCLGICVQSVRLVVGVVCVDVMHLCDPMHLCDAMHSCDAMHLCDATHLCDAMHLSLRGV